MSDSTQAITCQRCGRGFMFTATYRDFLARRGAKVVVPVLCMSCFFKAGPLPKQRGRVKWFNRRRSYGFIVTEENEQIFFHQQQLVEGGESKPHEGRAVRFHVRYAAKGPEALNVELLGE